jgi:hypothetical protein
MGVHVTGWQIGPGVGWSESIERTITNDANGMRPHRSSFPRSCGCPLSNLQSRVLNLTIELNFTVS